MNDTKQTVEHTPGPWVVNDREGRRFIEGESERWGQSFGWVYIAELKRHRLGSADRVCPEDIQLANARLIAAAPELLEACRSAVRWWGSVGDSGRAPSFIRECQSAIAKAEGRTD